VTLWQMGEFDKATKELQAALQVKPDYAEAYYTLGTVYKQQNKLTEAASALRDAIRLQPDFAGAHTTLAAVLRQLGDDQGAAREAAAGLQISKEKTALQAAAFNTNSGIRMLTAGDTQGAIAQFRSAIQLAPSYAPGHYQLGLALLRQGSKDEARAEFDKALALDSSLKPPQK